MKKRSAIDLVILVGIIIVIFFVIKGVRSGPGSINTGQAIEQWNAMTHAQKIAWLNNYIENPDEEGVRLIDKMDDAIKSHLNSPPVVNYDRSPKFNIARVVEADNGFIDIENSGTLKSSSGIRETFSYLCKLKITPFTKELVDVIVDVHD